jgi:hypothetical protein
MTRRYRRQAREAVRLVLGFLVLAGVGFFAVGGARLVLSLFGGAR